MSLKLPVKYDFTSDWSDKFFSKIKLPSLPTDPNLEGLGFNNIMFAYVFL